MPSTTVIFDSYVLKCWADAARCQTLALEALADFLDARLENRLDARLEGRLHDRREDRLEGRRDTPLDIRHD